MARRNGGLEWRPTKIMNMHDLSNDDDFLSHLLVEKLGTGAVPLYVHKMDPTRRLPKTDAVQLLDIVRRVRSPHTLLAVLCSHSSARSIQEHSSERCPARDRRPPPVGLLLLFPLLTLTPLVSLQSAIISSPTPRSKSTPLLRMSYPHNHSHPSSHASRYFELYNPSGSIEIAHTSRYSHKTGKSELCILATRQLVPGTVITELKGSMANLTDQEDRDLKKASFRSGDIRRDFSVIHSRSMKKNHLFLGPARFVNVRSLFFFLSLSFHPLFSHSMTVTTTASSFAKADTSHFVSSGLSKSARKLPPIMAMATVCINHSYTNSFSHPPSSRSQESSLPL